jgi:hypothetical protein
MVPLNRKILIIVAARSTTSGNVACRSTNLGGKLNSRRTLTTRTTGHTTSRVHQKARAIMIVAVHVNFSIARALGLRARREKRIEVMFLAPEVTKDLEEITTMQQEIKNNSRQTTTLCQPMKMLTMKAPRMRIA